MVPSANDNICSVAMRGKSEALECRGAGPMRQRGYLQQLSAHIRFGHTVNLHSPLPSVVSAIALLHDGAEATSQTHLRRNAEIHARFETYVVVHLEHICTIVPMCEGSTPIEIYTWWRLQVSAISTTGLFRLRS